MKLARWHLEAFAFGVLLAVLVERDRVNRRYCRTCHRERERLRKGRLHGRTTA